jgi:hypothetical protein
MAAIAGLTKADFCVPHVVCRRSPTRPESILSGKQQLESLDAVVKICRGDEMAADRRFEATAVIIVDIKTQTPKSVFVLRGFKPRRSRSDLLVLLFRLERPLKWSRITAPPS